MQIQNKDNSFPIWYTGIIKKLRTTRIKCIQLWKQQKRNQRLRTHVTRWRVGSTRKPKKILFGLQKWIQKMEQTCLKKGLQPSTRPTNHCAYEQTKQVRQSAINCLRSRFSLFRNSGYFRFNFLKIRQWLQNKSL